MLSETNPRVQHERAAGGAGGRDPGAEARARQPGGEEEEEMR